MGRWWAENQTWIEGRTICTVLVVVLVPGGWLLPLLRAAFTPLTRLWAAPAGMQESRAAASIRRR